MQEDKQLTHEHEPGHDLHLEYDDLTIRLLHKVIRFAVKVLAILMVLVIVWGIGDVLFVLYQRLTQPPFLLLQIDDLLATFGAFLAVLIAIEIFINIKNVSKHQYNTGAAGNRYCPDGYCTKSYYL